MRAKTSKSEIRRSPCAIACSLDLVGDKWSLLVVRDLLRGKTTYSELLDSPEGIPTTTLAERLRRLEEGGVIRRAAYQKHPVRYAYTLTQKGKSLGDVLSAVVSWGKRYIPGTKTLSEFESESAQMDRPGRPRQTS
jgi:DNA-binding HxlR family transcriptional regulator